jgi:hypothetical protein
MQSPLSLSENHRRGISVSLRLLDKELCEWERWTRGDVMQGVIYRQRDTLLAAQKESLRSLIRTTRDLIVQLRDRFDLDAEVVTTSRLLMAHATVLWEQLAELNSRSLSGYGAISAETANLIDPIAKSLRRR